MYYRPASRAAAVRPRSARFDFAGCRALMLEDSPLALDILHQVLVGFGVRNPLPARSLGEARKALRESLFDLIIVDGDLRQDEGLALTRELRAEPESPNATAPVVVLSAYTSTSRIFEVRDAGANVVVRKPIVPAVLLDRIGWLARCPRPFVAAEGYRGPDRRFRTEPLPEGMAERRAEGLRLLGQPERALSQDEIDSLFG